MVHIILSVPHSIVMDLNNVVIQTHKTHKPKYEYHIVLSQFFIFFIFNFDPLHTSLHAWVGCGVLKAQPLIPDKWEVNKWRVKNKFATHLIAANLFIALKSGPYRSPWGIGTVSTCTITTPTIQNNVNFASHGVVCERWKHVCLWLRVTKHFQCLNKAWEDLQRRLARPMDSKQNVVGGFVMWTHWACAVIWGNLRNNDLYFPLKQLLSAYTMCSSVCNYKCLKTLGGHFIALQESKLNMFWYTVGS